MKPTKEQIEKYIDYADLEMGPECMDEWVDEVRKYLRAWANNDVVLPKEVLEVLRAGGDERGLKGALWEVCERIAFPNLVRVTGKRVE
jgi:hypothetical protein